MNPRSLRIVVLIAVMLGIVGTASAANTGSGSLTGNWAGYISRQTSWGVKRQHITITVNARQNGGTWKLTARCYGTLTLENISDGYHHYLRHVAKGGNCAGGDIDCLKRAGANLYDAVTAHQGGSWDTSGTLKSVRV
jgi:hypothetical protein